MYEDRSLLLEGVQIIFRNFEGREGDYNRAGDRSFAILLDDELYEQMLKDGWNVKRLKPRGDDEVGRAYIEVEVSYKKRPPRVVLLSSKGRTPLDEEDLDILDQIDIDWVDVRLNPYSWSVSGRSGIKAYLKTIYVKMHTESLDTKYEQLPEVSMNGRPLAIEGAETPAIEAGPGFDYVDGEVVENADHYA